MSAVNILVEAKKEYTNQLQKILTPRLYEGFKSIYEDIIVILTKELEENKTQSSSLIKTFQKMLKEIPQWNNEMIKNEYNRILKVSNCDYFENLIEAVFITNTKILTSVQVNDTKSINIKINIPQPSHFIHKCYIECSKEIYKNPYIFDQSKSLNPKEKHNNLRDILNILDNSINTAIRDLLPIRDILKQGLTKMNNNILDNKLTSDEDSTHIDESNDLVNKLEDNFSDEQDEVNELDEEDDEGDNEGDDDDEGNEEDNDEVNNEVNDEGDDEEDNEDDNEGDEVDDKTNINEVIETKNYEINNVNETNNDLTETKSYEYSDIKNIDSIQKGGSIILDKEKTIELTISKDIEEADIKEIIYSKNSLQNYKKFESVQKITEDKNNVNEIILEPKVQKILEHKVETISEPKIQKILEFKNKEDVNNPFIKNIKNSKFIKNKYIGGDKINTFYKKKYQENSANYKSSLTENNSNKVDVQESNKIVKNQINLDLSDEEEDEVDLDI